MITSLAAGASRILAALLVGLVGLYRLTLGPVLHALGGPGSGCRFQPSCSVYAQESLRLHGPWRGARLALGRLLRCHPFHPGGYDPPPAREI